jgi:quercetin dioxygenase-like cupin family protein
MKTEFKPNVNLMKAFKSQIMLINDTLNAENGLVLHRAGADGPPIHIHPEQDELIRVITGELEVYVKDKWITLNEGDSVFVLKKTAHTYRSRHDKDCVFEYTLTPVRHFSEMMRSFEKLQNEGKLNGTDLKSIIYLSMNFKKYKGDVVSVSPPPFVISAMAGIGKLMGYQL